jgi:hypothetical protein
MIWDCETIIITFLGVQSSTKIKIKKLHGMEPATELSDTSCVPQLGERQEAAKHTAAEVRPD